MTIVPSLSTVRTSDFRWSSRILLFGIQMFNIRQIDELYIQPGL